MKRRDKREFEFVFQGFLLTEIETTMKGIKERYIDFSLFRIRLVLLSALKQ